MFLRTSKRGHIDKKVSLNDMTNDTSMRYFLSPSHLDIMVSNLDKEDDEFNKIFYLKFYIIRS